MGDWWTFIWNVLTIVQCSKILLAAWLRKRVEELRPEAHDGEWTIDAFLYEHRHEIESTSEGGRKRRLYFPGYGKRTEVETWDLQMLTFVLKNFCCLDERMEGVLNNLRDLRNTFVNRREQVQSVGEDHVQQSRLNEVISQLKVYINDHEIDIKVDEKIRAISDLVERQNSGNISEHLKILRHWYETDQETNEMLLDLRHGQTEILSLLRQHMTGKEIRIPDTYITMVIKNYAEEEEEKISEYLIRLLNEERDDRHLTLDDDPDENLRNAVRRAMHRFLNDRIVDVRSKCVRLTIRCQTLSSLLDLLEDCVTGKLTDIFKPVEKELRRQNWMEHVELSIEIEENDFWKCIQDIVRQMFPRELKSADVKREIDKVVVSLRVSTPTETDAQVLKKVIARGSEMDSFNELTDLMRKYLQVPELKIAMNLSEEVQSISIPHRKSEEYGIDSLKEVGARLSMIGVRLSSVYDSVEIPSDKERTTALPGDTRHVFWTLFDAWLAINSGNFSPYSVERTKVAVKSMSTWLISLFSRKKSTPKFPRVSNVLVLDRETSVEDRKVYITGMSPVSDTYIVYIDNANRLISLVDTQLNMTISCLEVTSAPWDVTTVTDSKIAVTLPFEKKILLISIIKGQLYKDKTIDVHGSCRGIVCSDDKLCVSFVGAKGLVQIINLDGVVLENLLQVKGNIQLRAPAHLAHCSKSNTLYICDIHTKILTTVSLNTKEINNFNVGNFIGFIGGIAVDENEKAYVTDWASDQVYKVDVGLKEIGSSMLIGGELKCPRSIAYCQDEQKMFVSRENWIQVFTVQAQNARSSLSLPQHKQSYERCKSEENRMFYTDYWADIEGPIVC